MASVLVAMPKHEDANRITELLKKGDLPAETLICRSAAETLSYASDIENGVVVCMKNLPDMNFAELFECLPAGFSMVLITGDTSLEFPPGRLKKLSIPFKSHEFVSTVDTLLEKAGGGRMPVRRRHRSAFEQQEIDAAKRRLMQARNMTEPEAYRYIQKYSMDAGRSLVESARMVLALLNNYGE